MSVFWTFRVGCLWGHQGICTQRRGCFSFLFFPLFEICSFLFEINAFIVHVYGKMLTDFVLINDICFGALCCGAFNKV